MAGGPTYTCPSASRPSEPSSAPDALCRRDPTNPGQFAAGTCTFTSFGLLQLNSRAPPADVSLSLHGSGESRTQVHAGEMRRIWPCAPRQRNSAYSAAGKRSDVHASLRQLDGRQVS